MARLGKVWGFAVAVTVAGLSGCAFQPAPAVCSAGDLASSASTDTSFSLVPTQADFTIYPGQTEQISVYVQGIGDATGKVTISPSLLPAGVTMAPVTAAIGSTAQLTVTAAPDVVSACFTGAQNVFTAARALTLRGTMGSAGSAATAQVAMNVVLENPDFVPAKTYLPVMNITTDDAAPVNSEDDYVEGKVTITDAAKSSYNYTGASGIKGHGNSTWFMPKKPYRLNLDSKASLMGMASSSNWILLANYDDKTMLRNDVAFQMSTMFGMAWTPSTTFLELYLNGQYEGVYELSERVEVSKARLNIGSMDDTDNSGTNLTGGYLGEIDHYDGETLMLTSQVGLPVGLDDPDPPTTEQASYFTSAFTAAESSMYASNFADANTGWRAHWDQDSVVNWFLVEELAGNQDADDWSSDYFYKPRGDGLFYRGPVWDMDITMGNTNYGAITDPSVPWVSNKALWYRQLFNDSTFLAAVKARWAEVRPQALTLPGYVDTRAAALASAADNNFGRWPNVSEKVWPNSEAAGSYQGEVDFMKSWLNARIAYMDARYLQ